MDASEPERPDHSSDSAWTLAFLAWLVASVSTLGALFLSQVMGIAPCVLCWYQRISMFPLVFILPAGLFPFDVKLVRYAFPLVVLGWIVALFHVLVVAGIVPETIRPCAQGIPCKDQVIEWFGFVTIPLLSLIAFSLIGLLLILTHFKVSK
ncbi:MAG: disulfide bond formation protein B [Pseudomonadota bacterium]